MIVAARAADGQTQQRLRSGIHLVVPFVSAFDGGRTVIHLPHAQPVQAQAGNHFVANLLVHLIAGQLRFDESVPGHVTVERLNHPIAIRVGRLVLLLVHVFLSDAIVVFGVARDVQPMPRPHFTEVRRGDQAVDHLLVSVRRFVRFERLHFFIGGHQSGKRVSDAPQQSPAVGAGDGFQPILFQLREHELIDVVRGPSGVFGLRRLRLRQRLKGPEMFLFRTYHVGAGLRGNLLHRPHRAVLHPSRQIGDLRLGEVPVLGHFDLGGLANRGDHHALFRRARHHGGSGLPALEQALERVQT